MITAQSVYKPGSVESPGDPDDHFSASMVTHALQQPTRGVLIEVDASRRIFGLAPTGVCRAVHVAMNAVGSYPTVSPLPPCDGGLFSVALSVT